MTSRVLNLEFHKELVLTHLVFQALHGTLDQLLVKIEDGSEGIITLPEDYFPRLSKLLRDMASALEKKQDICRYIESASVFLHVLTGNGFYLYQRGVLSLD